MRILLWYWGRRGGGAQMTLGLATGLARRPGIALALSVSAQADLLAETAALGLPMDPVPTYASLPGFLAGTVRVPWLAQRLERQAREFRADAVVSVMTHLWTPLVAPALPRAGIPFIPVVHDALPHPGDPGFAWGWRLRRELAAATGAITLSDAVAEAIRRRCPALPLARLTLGALLPATVLPPRAPSASTRFLMFGRLRGYKGLDLLRDAWPLLRECCPDATLRVVGEGDAEALAPGLAALPGVTVVPRWVAEADIPALLAAADAVVMPYREASQSGVVGQAYALGVPVVATPVGGLVEQVRDGVDGILAEAVSAPALAVAMARLCDPAARARLALGARAAGEALVDWDARAMEFVAALAGLLGRPER
jgi:glycosyltransferase involved in cell wall biosynthesis